jgi:ATP synthase protein I
MNKPATLSRHDLAIKLLSALAMLGFVVWLASFFLLPDFTIPLAYGVCIFLLANLLFAFYSFRYTGARSGSLMIKSFGQGVAIKIAVLAIGLLAVFKLDARTQDLSQAAAILLVLFFMQLAQIFLSLYLGLADARKHTQVKSK